MLALYRSGRRADALDVYRDGRVRSVDQLGIELGPELRELEQAILNDDSALSAPPRERPPPSTRAAVALLAAAVLLGVAAGSAFFLEQRAKDAVARPAIDLTTNAVAGLARDGRPAFAVTLPGRPTDIAALGAQLYAVSVDTPALTVADARTRRVTHSVPLPMRPAAVAVGGGDVWIVDGQRGLAVRLDGGYERVAARATWRRASRSAGDDLLRLDPTGVAVTAGTAWITDGSSTLIRADAGGTVRRTRLPHRADGIAAGAGAVWAFSHRGAAVMRLDRRTGRLTDVVPLARPAAGSPAPIAIAARGRSVWVLNGNTATLSRIDARTRGVLATVQLRRERSPRDIEAGARDVWVVCFDGSVVRVPEHAGAARTTDTGGALVGAAASGPLAWVASTALDQGPQDTATR